LRRQSLGHSAQNCAQCPAKGCRHHRRPDRRRV